MDRGEWFIGGEADRRFEQEFAAYCRGESIVELEMDWMQSA